MLPEVFSADFLLLTFFLLAVVVMVIMFVYHHIQSKKPHLTAQQVMDKHPFKAEITHLTKDAEPDELEHIYKKDLDRAVDEFAQKLYDNAKLAEGQFVEYLENLKANAAQSQSILDQSKQDRIDKLFTDLEGNLHQTITQTINTSLTNIQKELEYSRSLVDTYTQKQLSLIDQNIIDLLERTLSLVLVKKLSLRDQLDLVYEALETAKIEKFLVPTNSQAGATAPAPQPASAPSPTPQPAPVPASTPAPVQQPPAQPPDQHGH